MIERQIIVVATETTGPDVGCHALVEVAWWNLTSGARGYFIPRHDVSKTLAQAHIEALRVSRYLDRIPGKPQDLDGRAAGDLWAAFLDWDEHDVDDAGRAAETRHILAGATPSFDARFLQEHFAELGLWPTAPWHHRLLDLSSYAAGVLGLDPTDLPSTRTVCELLGVPPGDHTATGDVDAIGQCFLRLRDRQRVAA